MDPMMSKLRDAIAAALPGAEVELHRYPPGTRFGGSIVWSGFVGLDQMDRQRVIRKLSDAALDVEGQLRVSMILTLTPEETAMIEA